MKKEHQSATVLTGKDTRLSRKKRKGIAQQVSKALRAHPDRMRQLSIGDVFRSIANGNASLTFAKEGIIRTGRLAAFAHVIPAMEELGAYEEGAVEVGAVVTLAEPGNGYAKNAVIEAIKIGERQGAKKVKTLVHVGNEAANGLMRRLAGEPVRTRPSNYVIEANGTRAQMNEYVLWEAERI